MFACSVHVLVWIFDKDQDIRSYQKMTLWLAWSKPDNVILQRFDILRESFWPLINTNIFSFAAENGNYLKWRYSCKLIKTISSSWCDLFNIIPCFGTLQYLSQILWTKTHTYMIKQITSMASMRPFESNCRNKSKCNDSV